MRNSRQLVMRPRAAQSFIIDRLAGRAFDQVRAAQSHERSAFDHDDDVRERRQVRAAGDARPHHRGNLRDFQIAPHDRVVIEDARRAVLSGKHAALIRKIHARRIDEIDDRHMRAHRDLLRAQNFLDRLRPPRSGFDGGIVSDHDNFAPADATDRRHHTRCRRAALVLVVGNKQTDFLSIRILVEQEIDSLPSGQLMSFVLLRYLVRTAAETKSCFQPALFIRQLM